MCAPPPLPPSTSHPAIDSLYLSPPPSAPPTPSSQTISLCLGVWSLGSHLTPLLSHISFALPPPAYAVDMTDFAEKMLKFVTFVETNEELGTSAPP
jgi:hypothetical protein